MAIKPRKPIRIDPIDVAEKVAVGVRLTFNKKRVLIFYYYCFCLLYSTSTYLLTYAS